jgi:hypothetical protein
MVDNYHELYLSELRARGIAHPVISLPTAGG